MTWFRGKLVSLRKSRRKCTTRSSRSASSWTRWFCTSSRIVVPVHAMIVVACWVVILFTSSKKGCSVGLPRLRWQSWIHLTIIRTECQLIWPVVAIMRLRCATTTMMTKMTVRTARKRWRWQSRAPIFATLASPIWPTCSKYSFNSGQQPQVDHYHRRLPAGA